MAIQNKTLNTADRTHIASQLAAYWQAIQSYNSKTASRSGVSKMTSPSRLGDEFPFRTVALAEVFSPPINLKPYIEQTEMWLHLVHTGSSITAHALSRQRECPSSPPEVVSLCSGPLALKIDRQSRWLDEHLPNDETKVAILAFPAHHTFAFGILMNDQTFTVLIDQPSNNTQLQHETVYPMPEFLNLLTQESNSSSLTF